VELAGLHSIYFGAKSTGCERIHKSLVKLAGSHFYILELNPQVVEKSTGLLWN